MVLVALAPGADKKASLLRRSFSSQYLAADLRPGSCALGLSLILIKFLHGQNLAKEAAKSFVTAIIAAGFLLEYCLLQAMEKTPCLRWTI